MKKIYSFFAIFAALLAFAACSDDDAGSEYLHQSQVNITSATITFTAKADTGVVDFTAPGEATATINSSWASAAVEGNQVRVSVQANPNLEGRSTLLTIKSGTDSANVTIQQQGMDYKYTGDSYYIFNDSAHQAILPLKNEGGNLSIQAPEWLNANISDEGLGISLGENTTGGIRSGEIYLQCGPYADTIQVMQGELKDIVNKSFTFIAYDLALDLQSNNIEDYRVERNAIIIADTIRNNVTPYIYLTEDDLMIPFEFLDENLISIIPGGTLVGTYARRYSLYTAIVDPSVYSSLNQSDTRYPALMASSYMCMLGIWGNDPQVGTYSVFNSYPGNLANWMGQLFNGLPSYDGYILGIFAFNHNMKPWIDDDGYVETDNLNYYVGPFNFFALPELVEHNVAGASKPAVLPIGPRDKSKWVSRDILVKDLQMLKQAKLGKKSSSQTLTLNKKAHFDSPSPFSNLKRGY